MSAGAGILHQTTEKHISGKSPMGRAHRHCTRAVRTSPENTSNLRLAGGAREIRTGDVTNETSRRQLAVMISKHPHDPFREAQTPESFIRTTEE
jgi:hypothetical protein